MLAKRHLKKITHLLNEPFYIVPIPLHRKRLIKRGFNQAELLARYIFPDNLINNRILSRKVNTPSQRGLNREERFKNLKNVFQVNATIDRNTTYIIFDDVYTTGATAKSAATALRKAGAKHISVITLARTPASKYET